MPKDDQNHIGSVYVIDAWFGYLTKTFRSLWGWVEAVHSNALCATIMDPYRMDLANADRYGTKPFVRWVKLDLAANIGTTARSVYDRDDAAGFQVLAAAAQHPDWARMLGTEGVPSVRLSSILAGHEGPALPTDTPLLSAQAQYGLVELRRVSPDTAFANSAMPTMEQVY